MTPLLCASLLALTTLSIAVYQAPAAEPILLGDARFHYAVSKLGGPASARTRTLWVQPARASREAQPIPLTGPAAVDPTTNVVVCDVNFDGQPDLMVTTNRGIVNSQYAYWLYEAATKRFVLNPTLGSALSGYRVTFDAATQRISTATRYSCCKHETRVYTFQQGQLKLLTSRTTKTVAQP